MIRRRNICLTRFCELSGFLRLRTCSRAVDASLILGPKAPFFSDKYQNGRARLAEDNAVFVYHLVSNTHIHVCRAIVELSSLFSDKDIVDIEGRFSKYRFFVFGRYAKACVKPRNKCRQERIGRIDLCDTFKAHLKA